MAWETGESRHNWLTLICV